MKIRFLAVLVVILHVITTCSGGWFSNFFKKKIEKATKIVDGGFVFKFWKEADVPLYMLVRFFNVTNPERVLRGDKPILEEVGPYVYQETRQNIIEKFSVDNSTVSYRLNTTYFFRPDFSQGSESDVITTLNLPYIVMQEKASNLSSMERYVAREIFTNNNETLFIQKSVSELLFEGYFQPSVAEMSELAGAELLPNNTFGYFHNKNGTVGDLLEIYTGVNDPSLFGQTKSWEGQTELNYWDDQYCNMINGSDGSVYSPWMTRNIVLKIFSPDICRSIYLVYDRDVRVTGFPGYRFVIPRDLLASPEENEYNRCYCNEEKFGPCLKTGAMRLAPCRQGAPVVVSWPHFYNGDETYVNQSIGLRPEASLHETFLVIEPHTGLLRRATKRFQINIELKPNRQFKDMKRVPNMLFPVLWVEESKLSRFRIQRYFNQFKNTNGSTNNANQEYERNNSPMPIIPFPFPPPPPLPVVNNVLPPLL